MQGKHHWSRRTCSRFSFVWDQNEISCSCSRLPALKHWVAPGRCCSILQARGPLGGSGYRRSRNAGWLQCLALHWNGCSQERTFCRLNEPSPGRRLACRNFLMHIPALKQKKCWKWPMERVVSWPPGAGAQAIWKSFSLELPSLL